MIEISLVKHTDEKEQLLELFRLSFGQTMPAELWDWKYVKNPLSSQDSEVVVAVDRGKIIGARPFLLSKMWIGDKIVTTAQHCDTMVHPDYRNRGIFNRMGLFALQHLKEYGYALCYGLPAPMSRRGFLSQGFRIVVTTETLYGVILPQQIISYLLGNQLLGRGLGLVYGRVANSRMRSNSNYSRSFQVDVFDRLGHELGEIDSLRDKSTIDLVRSESYLRWRFDSHPQNTYKYVLAKQAGELRGYAVISIEELGNGLIKGIVVDYLVANADVACFREIMDRCLEEFRHTECAFMVVWAFSEPSLRKELMEHFGLKSPLRFPYNRFASSGYLDALCIDERVSSAINVYDGDLWRVTLAYTDTR